MGEKSSALAWQLGEQLLQRGLTVGVAESCTGGGICQSITDIPGSSKWFEQGFVTYSNRAKQAALAVPANALEEGAVSQSVVEAMVVGAMKSAGAALGVAVSGIAGPDGGSAEKPVGTVWFAWGFGENISSQCEVFRGNRSEVREQAVERALLGLLALLAEE